MSSTGDQRMTLNSVWGNVSAANFSRAVCESVFCRIAFPAQRPHRFRRTSEVLGDENMIQQVFVKRIQCGSLLSCECLCLFAWVCACLALFCFRFSHSLGWRRKIQADCCQLWSTQTNNVYETGEVAFLPVCPQKPRPRFSAKLSAAETYSQGS